MVSTFLFRLDRLINDRATDTMLSFALFTVAGTLVLVGIAARPGVKALVLSWVVAP